MFRPLCVVLVVLCALSACGGGGGGGAADRAEVPAAHAVTTTSTVVDEWAVPDPVTPEYVERVLTELYRIQGDALRLAMREGAVNGRPIALLDSIYDSELSNRFITELSDSALKSFAAFQEDPGDIGISQISIDEMTPTCMVARATLDYADVSATQRTPVPVSLALRASSENPTGWELRKVLSEESASCD